MNTAVAEIDPSLLSERAPNALLAGFAQLDATRKALLGLGVLALVGLLALAFYMANRPDYRVLYANLSDKDGGAVLAQLSQMNVPYKHAEGGNAILVPSDRLHDIRLQLASQGLPKGTVTGFEMMDGNKLGMTQFQERLSYQRGLEGELTRSIAALSSVAEARVHLALPNQNGFFREQQKPSASVLLTLYPGRVLDKAQVAGIVHLVASSVPEMNPKAVSVVDQHGALLSQVGEGQPGGAESQQLEYVRTLEQMYAKRIVDLLEPVLGRDNVRAQVTADIDFSEMEQTSEQHRPNQGNNEAAVRSTQLVESGSSTDQPAPGVPGAVANLPPGAAQAPINGNAAPVGVVPGGNVAGGSEASRRREQVTNYEVDRTVQVKRNGAGAVRRLSAAVVLNHVSSTDRKGQTSSSPLPAEQMEQINALVREAIGFSTQRGDSVNVMNAAFTKPDLRTTELAWWKEAGTQDLARSMVWPVGLLVLGMLLFFGMVRPSLKMMKTGPATLGGEGAAKGSGQGSTGLQLDAIIDNDTQRPGLPQPVQNEPSVELLRLEDAKRLARENPVAVANIVKGWVNGDGASTA